MKKQNSLQMKMVSMHLLCEKEVPVHVAIRVNVQCTCRPRMSDCQVYAES